MEFPVRICKCSLKIDSGKASVQNLETIDKWKM